MKRVISAAILCLMASASSGCCHLWENIHYWEDCLFCECGSCDVQGCGWGWGDYGSGHGACGHDGCSGCGGCYYGEWHQGGGCEPCDCYGNWVGPGAAQYGTPHYGAGYGGSVYGGAVAQQETVESHSHQAGEERSAIVAEQPQYDHAGHDHATPKRLR